MNCCIAVPLPSALVSLLLAGLLLATANAGDLTYLDFALAVGTCERRIELAHATARAARNGSSDLRAVFTLDSQTAVDLLNSQHGHTRAETYVYWPDRSRDRKKPGDTRLALTPWLAHRALGETYKWLLHGDDDTLFFMSGLLALLQRYDHNLPYVITDSFWHHAHRNMADAPRCLPCHGSGGDGAPGPDVLVPPLGCPCTPELACNFTLRAMGLDATGRNRPFSWCQETKLWDFPEPYPTMCDYPHFHGGSGVIISIGALRKVPWDAALRCLYDDPVKLVNGRELNGLREFAHSDRLTSLCFWVNGVALTDPGVALRAGVTIDPTRALTDNRAANVAELERVVAGERSRLWESAAANMTSVHVGHRKNAAPYAWRLMDRYSAAQAYLRDRNLTWW